MHRELPLSTRLPLLAAGIASLALGIATGLFRMGWNFPLPAPSMAAWHGPWMICGFLGTLIGLERAVAIGARWAMLGPLFSALGSLAMLAGTPPWSGPMLMALASLVLVCASAVVVVRQSALYSFTLWLGSAAWLTGNLLWLHGLSFAQVAPWWATFLILTIAGERLELSRMLPPSRFGQAAFAAIVALLLAGAAAAVGGHVKLLAAALLGLSLWLLRQDIARRTILQHGLPRFIAACLLSGYLWLLAGAAIGLSVPALLPGSSYDAFLHAIFVGFVFSMIFGHAPIIFPAVARVKIAYHSSFYLPLVVLHISLVARIAGDLLQIPHCRSAGGVLNAVALGLFILGTAAAVARGMRK